MTIISAGNSNVSIELGNIIIIVAENVICSKVSVKIGHTLTHTVNGGYSFLSRSKNVTEITENTSSSWHLFSIFVPKLGLVHPWDSYLTIFHRSVRLS